MNTPFSRAALLASYVLLFSARANAQSCAVGPFTVFFDAGSSKITGSSPAILDNAAAALKSCATGKFVLQGHTDTAGTNQANQILSKRRAESVKVYLASKGIPAASMTVEGLGESRLLVETDDGVREPQNNFVEIRVAGDGW